MTMNLLRRLGDLFLYAGIVVSQAAAAETGDKKSVRQEDWENLALRAKIQATSVHSVGYAPQNVADGEIPAAMSKADTGKA